MFLLGAFAVVWVVAVAPAVATGMYVDQVGPFAPDENEVSQSDNDQVSQVNLAYVVANKG